MEICKECQFENGKHSLRCPKYEGWSFDKSLTNKDLIRKAKEEARREVLEELPEEKDWTLKDLGSWRNLTLADYEHEVREAIKVGFNNCLKEVKDTIRIKQK